MTTFDRREEGFESMFAHDEEMHFLAEAHRTKMLGAWVAESKGLTGADAQAYAANLVAYSVATGGDQALFDRVRADLPASVTDSAIRGRMAAMMTESVAFVKTA